MLVFLITLKSFRCLFNLSLAYILLLLQVTLILGKPSYLHIYLVDLTVKELLSGCGVLEFFGRLLLDGKQLFLLAEDVLLLRNLVEISFKLITLTLSLIYLRLKVLDVAFQVD